MVIRAVSDKPPGLSFALAVLTLVVVPFITAYVGRWKKQFSLTTFLQAFAKPAQTVPPPTNEKEKEKP